VGPTEVCAVDDCSVRANDGGIVEQRGVNGPLPVGVSPREAEEAVDGVFPKAGMGVPRSLGVQRSLGVPKSLGVPRSLVYRSHICRFLI